MLATILLGCFGLSTSLSAEPVELYLLDPIDSILNNYCLDTNGPPTNMQLDSPLQAHTCYSYQGDLTADQAMDSEDIANGKLRIVAVDLCAQIDGNEPGATISLSECAAIDEQHFELRANGQIVPVAYPELCLTTGPTSWRGGPAGGPYNDNLARTLHLQRCGEEARSYQSWGTREGI